MILVLCGGAAAIGLAGWWQLRKTSLFWSNGLLLGAIAAAMYAWAGAGSELAFKLYYALGASMLPGWIGVGSLQAAFGRRLARWPAILVLTLSVLQLALILPAGLSATGLAQLDGSNGAGILVMGAWVVPTVLFNTFGLGFAAVAAFAAWWRAFRRPAAVNATLAIGLSVVVLGVLCRSDAVYKMMAESGGAQLFMLLDLLAFALIWAGARLTIKLPAPIGRLLQLDALGSPAR